MEKATGITRPVVGKKDWVELWVGDIIKCRVYITDRAGVYLYIDEATVIWEPEYGMYSINGIYTTDGQKYRNVWPLHKIVREDITFITKVERLYGTEQEIVLAIVDLLRSYHKEPDDISDFKAELDEVDDDVREQAIIDAVTTKSMVSLVSAITDMGVVSHTEIHKAFNRER